MENDRQTEPEQISRVRTSETFDFDTFFWKFSGKTQKKSTTKINKLIGCKKYTNQGLGLLVVIISNY